MSPLTAFDLNPLYVDLTRELQGDPVCAYVETKLEVTHALDSVTPESFSHQYFDEMGLCRNLARPKLLRVERVGETSRDFSHGVQHKAAD
jgi:hypothetical protein